MASEKVWEKWDAYADKLYAAQLDYRRRTRPRRVSIDPLFDRLDSVRTQNKRGKVAQGVFNPNFGIGAINVPWIRRHGQARGGSGSVPRASAIGFNVSGQESPAFAHLDRLDADVGYQKRLLVRSNLDSALAIRRANQAYAATIQLGSGQGSVVDRIRAKRGSSLANAFPVKLGRGGV
jgi:hypothetical protein